MLRKSLIGCLFAAVLGGCSLYPIPEDVSPFRTEQIVRYGRCEMRSAILDHLVRLEIIADPSNTAHVIAQIAKLKDKAKNHPKALEIPEQKALRLTKVAVAYSFDFHITETNGAHAGAGFRLPSLTNTLDVGGTAGLDLTRVGSRVFGTEDKWDQLIVKRELCDDYQWRRPANFAYPMTGAMGAHPVNGSIGVGRVVETFIDIDEQGGAKDNFVDTLTFTTSVGAGANAGIKLDPVASQFRLVSASADIAASRLDVHKLTISLAFPQEREPEGGVKRVKRFEGDLNAPEANAPFERPAAWRARYNLCVQDARTREGSFKQLRLTDPIVYCISYADEFVPKYGRGTETQTVVTQTRTIQRAAGAPAGAGAPPGAAAAPGAPAAGAPARAAPVEETTTTTTTPRVRPNLRPFFQ